MPLARPVGLLGTFHTFLLCFECRGLDSFCLCWWCWCSELGPFWLIKRFEYATFVIDLNLLGHLRFFQDRRWKLIYKGTFLQARRYFPYNIQIDQLLQTIAFPLVSNQQILDSFHQLKLDLQIQIVFLFWFYWHWELSI